MYCKNCNESILGIGVSKGKFCCNKCKWTWHNNNRTLKPNLIFECMVCGKNVSIYVSPSRIGKDAKGMFCSRKCKGQYMSGDKHPMWNGGKSTQNGYVIIKAHNHPYSGKNNYIPEHRVIMEKNIGRYLLPDEVVHHKNGDISDNRISNLELFKNNAEHMAYHDQNTLERDHKNGRFVSKSRSR